LAVARARLAYDDLVLNAPGTCEGQLEARLVPFGTSIGDLDPLVAARVQRSQTAATLTQANELFRAGRLEEARRSLRGSLSALQARKEEAKKRAPRARAPAVARDFDEQAEALAAAESGFAVPPPGAGPDSSGEGEAARKNKAQVRSNQERALELSF
jgi:Ca-activated chloride channel family protein